MKEVRLPNLDEQDRVYLDLWDLVKEATSKEKFLRASQGALEHIYSGRRKDFTERVAHFEELRYGPPPVMLVVTNDAKRARWFFEHILTQYFDYLGQPDEDDSITWYTS